MGEYLPFVSIDTWTIIMSWGNLLILYLLLKRFLFKPINKMLDERANEIETDYRRAEETEASAKALRAEYEAMMENAGEKADGIIKAAVETANLRSGAVLDEANDRARRIIEKSQKQIGRDREAALSEARADIASMAIDAAERLIRKQFNAADDEKLIEDIIDKI